MPDETVNARDRARKIVNGWIARCGKEVDGEIVMPSSGIGLTMSLADLEIELARQIDLAERAAWCSATKATKTNET